MANWLRGTSRQAPRPPDVPDGKEKEEEQQALGGAALRRQLRHVTQLALRGLEYEEAASDGYFLEVTPESAPEEVLERSDVFRTRNPTWTPACGLRGARQLSSMRLSAVPATHISGPTGEASALATSRQPFWSEVVCLPTLVPICEELEELLRPPIGLPLLRLAQHSKESWHVSASAKATPAPSAEPRKPAVRANARMREIEASKVCGAGERISDLLDRLRVLQEESAGLRSSMEQSLEHGRELSDQRARHLLCQQRLSRLRFEAEQRKERVAGIRAKLDCTQVQGTGKENRLMKGRSQLDTAEAERLGTGAEMANKKGQLRTLQQQLRCRHVRMLHEVRQVYPIDNHGAYRTIRDLCVASVENLSRQDLREEESVSTALGFLAHLLVTLASVLEVPLRIQVHNAGCSRSYLTDPHEAVDHSAAPREWPLYYGRGLERNRFERAVRLLRNGLQHFVYSRGYLEHMRGPNAELLEIAELILQREMRGVD